MATLVLSTVGTMLGGPIGGAIGSLLGQSIDQQLLGPGPRHGPRLGDLAVQTSSYGTAIPKVFGTMRVAGSIIWSTDLVEHSQTQGAKGQTDSVTYSYSASFAVALSARRIAGIGRIWADGKLIRTAEGEFTVATAFRFHDGSEDQDPDPLIASIEGVAQTPAHRGLAVAVFEDLELAQFGNRIPFLTFEVQADPADVGLADILAETSGGLIVASQQQAIGGYAAHGPSIAAAVEQLVDMFRLALFDNGSIVASAADDVIAIASHEFGCAAQERGAARMQRSQLRARSLPSAVTLSYYDRARDYQAATVRSSVDGVAGKPDRLELAAVLDTSSAKALVSTHLARRWAERDRLTLHLPPSRIATVPGTIVELESGERWRVDQVTLDALVAAVELSPLYSASEPLSGDPGRVLSSTSARAAPTKLLLLEVVDLKSGDASAPVILAAASAPSVALQVQVGARLYTSRTAPLRAVIGTASTALAPGQSALFDEANSVEVELHDQNLWLESRDAEALVAGENLAMLGDEIIQFGLATPLAPGRFRLSLLLRGRRGSEWAMTGHAVGEAFVLLEAGRLQPLQVTSSDNGALLQVTSQGFADGGATPVTLTISGEAMRPPTPVHLRTSLDPTGGLTCSWIRRSSRGWAWLDGVDAPLGCSRELYRATISGVGGRITVETATPTVSFSGAQTATVGPGEIEISVVQVGDFAASRPAVLRRTIN